LKIVLLTQYYPPEIGGAPVFLGSFAHELNKQCHDVKVVTALPNYPTGRIFDGYRGKLFVREVRDGVPVFRTWVYAAQSARLLPRLTNYFSFCISSLLAFGWMGKPDVVFVDSPPLFLVLTALLIARLKGARCVMNVSDLWPDAVADSGLVQSSFLINQARKLEAFLYRASDFVGSVTEGICEILVKDKHVPKNKVLFLPIGVDTDLFRPIPPDTALLEKYNLNGKKVFTYAGTLGHAYGLPLILEAAEHLKRRSDIAFLFVGDGPVKEQLRAESAARGLSSVTFIDPVPLNEMPRWWSLCQGALVTLKDQPVHMSARPSKSLPPMASGIPVIFSGIGEMGRIISEANAGLVLPPEKAQPLVEGILRLADDTALARELGRNGRRLCVQELSWHTVVQRWLNNLADQTTIRHQQDREVAASDAAT
jgi:colanic acid biosynthesis glycosyl transferase WcaI